MEVNYRRLRNLPAPNESPTVPKAEKASKKILNTEKSGSPLSRWYPSVIQIAIIPANKILTSLAKINLKGP